MTTRPTDSRLQDELQRLFAKARMPTSPALAARILELIDDPNSTPAQFTAVIQSDAALAGRLLKMANSARFAQRSEVTTIRRAVTLIGLRQLRVVVLGFELVGHLDRLGRVAFDLSGFWKQSVLRACLARELAREVVPDLAEDAFLVGLLQDCGKPLLVQVLGDEYGELCRQPLAPAEFHAREVERFWCTHVDAVAALAALWKLPAAIVGPLSSHHNARRVGRAAPAPVRLEAVSYLAGSLDLAGGAETVPGGTLQQYAAVELGLDEGTLDACVEAAGERFGDLAALFSAALGDDLDIADLLVSANRQLQKQAEDCERHMRDVEAERDQILDEQITLRNALGQYRAQAARDPLTAVLNRRALLDATIYCIRRAEVSGSTISVLFLDLDNFKALNDEHGHRAGDAVLKAVAKTLVPISAPAGYVGRYGGEEFVVVLPGLSEAEARTCGDRVVRAVRDTAPEGVALRRPVTVSIGAVWCEPNRRLSAEDLFARADELMYLAKRGGKDRCCFRSLPTPKVEAPEPGVAASGSARDRPALEPPAAGSSPERLRSVAGTLNAETRDWAASGRKQDRVERCVPCTVCLFGGAQGTARCEPGCIRNVSAGGLGLVIGGALVRGDLVEITVEADERTLYLAGIVAFCRRVEEGVHDAGIQLYHQSWQPILSRADGVGLDEPEWLRALLHPDDGARRRSA